MKNRKLLLGLLLFALIGMITTDGVLAKTSVDGQETETDWTKIGPDNVSGRVRAAMFDKFNYGVVYAGTVSGLYVSVDNGNSWREIAFASGRENITALSQDENGVIYVGTGEGYYNLGMHGENHLGSSDAMRGSVGSGVYKSNSIDKEWTAGFENGAYATEMEKNNAKYAWICSNLTFGRIPGTETANNYNDMQDWAFINAMAYSNNMLYVATKNAGLKVINTITNEIQSIELYASEIHDVVVSPEGKVAVSYLDVTSSNIAIIDRDDNGGFVPRVIFDRDNLESGRGCGRIKLTFGNNNPGHLYAYLSDGYNAYRNANAETNKGIAGQAMGIYRTLSVDEGMVSWQSLTASTYNNGVQHEYAMCLAVTDYNNEEKLYAGANHVVYGEDVNGNGIFSMGATSDPTATLTSGAYLPSNVHNILFMPNPKTVYDSVLQLYTTDAGVYVYHYDTILKAALITPAKGIDNLQVYKVSAAADGSVMAATQSNSMVYIPAPIVDAEKSAKQVWAVNSVNYPMSLYEMNNIASPAYSSISTSGTGIVASAINKTLPAASTRKPFIMAKPFINLARTYGNKGVYDEVETETTWNFGGAAASGDMGVFMSEYLYSKHQYSNFVTPIAYWEKFDGAADMRDSIGLTLKEGSKIFRGNDYISIVRGQEILEGDKILISDNSCSGYPFIFEFDNSYRKEAVNSMVSTNDGAMVRPLFYFDTTSTDTTAYKFKILPKVQSKFMVSSPQGIFITGCALDFTRKYDMVARSDIADTNRYFIWKRLYSISGDIPSGGEAFNVKPFNKTIRNIAFSADGASAFATIDIYDNGTGNDSLSYFNYDRTELIRIDGLNDFPYFTLGNTLGGRMADTAAFSSKVIGSFDRKISSIATDPNNANKLVITFDGYKNGNNVMYSSNVMSAQPSFTAIANPPQANSEVAPVYSALIERFQDNALFVGTEDGIYKMTNFTNGGTWEKDADINIPVYDLWQQTKNLPEISYMDNFTGVDEMVKYAATENAGCIYAATYGKGVLVNRKYQQENPEPQSYVSLASVKNNDEMRLAVYPNPCTDVATISYSLANNSRVVFRMYDMNGRLVSVLDNGREAKGVHTQLIDVNNMVKGIYVIQMSTDSNTQTAKLVVE